MDTALEAEIARLTSSTKYSFNPHSNGYCSGRPSGNPMAWNSITVSILILMDTALEACED